jgi:hypothetical protein
LPVHRGVLCIASKDGRAKAIGDVVAASSNNYSIVGLITKPPKMAEAMPLSLLR